MRALFFGFILCLYINEVHPSQEFNHACVNDEFPGEVIHLKFGKTFLQRVTLLGNSVLGNHNTSSTENFLESHGSIIAYFKKKQSNAYGEKHASGFMNKSGIVTTAAHAILCIQHEADNELQKKMNQEFLEEHESYSCKIHFFSKSRIRYEVESYFVHPQYFCKDKAYRRADIALLYLSKNKIIPSNYTVQFYNALDIKPYVNGRMHAYTTKEIIKTQTLERFEHPLNGSCEITCHYTATDMATLPEMSGANSFFSENDNCFLIAVHTLGNCENKLSALYHSIKGNKQSIGVTLNRKKQACLHSWYHNLLKQTIWNNQKKTTTGRPALESWKPVLLSIQADGDKSWQKAFMKKLSSQIKKMCLQDSIQYNSDVFSNLFTFFTLSGNGEQVLKKHFKIKLNNSNCLKDRSISSRPFLFSEPTSRDMTLEGIDTLLDVYPDLPAIVISLGISLDSERISKKVKQYTTQGFIYEWLDYLHLHGENNIMYKNKLNFEANKIAKLLVKNYLFLHPVDHNKQEENTDTFSTISSATINTTEVSMPGCFER